MDWPEHFPEYCPPEDADDTDHTVYRFVNSNPPREDDLKSHRERFEAYDFGDKECLACGLSVYTEVNDIINAQKRVPGMAKKLIAKFELQNGDGKIKHTSTNFRDSHHTWWVPITLNGQDKFKSIIN